MWKAFLRLLKGNVVENENKVETIEDTIIRLRKMGATQKEISLQVGKTQNEVKAQLLKLMNEGKVERKIRRTSKCK